MIDPGKVLSVDLTLSLEVVGEHGANGLLFSFNPDMVIHELRVNGIPSPNYKFEHGLLLMNESEQYPHGSKIVLEISASGMPNNQFEYLDSAIDLYRGTMFDAQILRLLGEHSLVFDRDFVALMDSAAWYPHAGPHIHKDRTSRKPTDFFSIDVEVEVPPNWSVAGPGKAIAVVGSPNRVRLNPEVPLPSLNVVADEFQRVATEVRGIEFELLLHPKHTKNLVPFPISCPKLRRRLRTS